MSHMDGRASMPWSYPSWSLPPTTPAPIPRNGQLVGFKRSRSDTEDCDDAYSDQSSKDQCSSPGDAESCQLKSRKKRRGIIEKRRRDRINSSLGELRVLVPTLQEKQGSAKLEKAEILQMTVEYLKMMRPKGCNPLGYDSGKFAMDYHNIGFQECITEVAKYLSIEGLETHDPLRMRLLSHLQHITTQREIASKQPPWYPATPPPPPPPPPPNASHHYQTTCSPLSSALGSGHHLPRPPPPSIPIPAGMVATPHHASLNSSSTSLELSSSGSLNSSSSLSNSHSINSSFDSSSSNAAANCEATPPSTTQSGSVATSSAALRPLTTLSSSDGYNYLHHSAHQHPSMDLYHHHAQHVQQQNPYAQSQTDPSVGSQMKPYRPWGAEVAY